MTPLSYSLTILMDELSTIRAKITTIIAITFVVVIKPDILTIISPNY